MPASQIIGYAGLEVEFKPLQERSFYYTKEKPKFLLHLKNIANQRVNIKLVWFLQTAVGKTGHDLIVELEPGQETIEEIGDRLLAIPGWGLVGILTPDPPLPPEEPGKFSLNLPTFHTLYTFQIFDEDVHRIQETTNKKMRRLSSLGAVAAAIAALTAIVSIIGAILGWW